jgi:hypothetical protein
MNIFQSAQNEWPEEEAYITVSDYKRRVNSGDFSPEELKEILEKDINHMVKIFSAESDGVELIARYKAFIRKEGLEIN